jgi:hypothetical protein
VLEAMLYAGAGALDNRRLYHNEKLPSHHSCVTSQAWRPSDVISALASMDLLKPPFPGYKNFFAVPASPRSSNGGFTADGCARQDRAQLFSAAICRCQTPFRGAILLSKPPGIWRMSANSVPSGSKKAIEACPCGHREAGTRRLAGIEACLSLRRPLHFDLSAPHADAGGARSRAISDRISANICVGTATSAI